MQSLLSFATIAVVTACLTSAPARAHEGVVTRDGVHIVTPGGTEGRGHDGRFSERRRFGAGDDSGRHRGWDDDRGRHNRGWRDLDRDGRRDAGDRGKRNRWDHVTDDRRHDADDAPWRDRGRKRD